MMKVVFMGTPDFALEALKAVIRDGYEVAAVVTGEDKARGRGHELTFTPVKEEALKHSIEVLQPENLKGDEIFDKLKSLNADVFIVAAYGRLLPKRILDIPPYGCINIHASLLPAYRGPAPIQWAIIDGIEKTGITTILMNEGLDTGDILKKYEVVIDKKETAGRLFERLACLGAEAIIDTLNDLRSGNLKPVKQKESGSSYAKMIKKQNGIIDFSQPAAYIERLIRGLNPWPSAYTWLDKKTLKIWSADICDSEFNSLNGFNELQHGSLICIGERLYTVCSDGFLEILSLQLEGKKRMDTASFLRGYTIKKMLFESP